MSDNAALLGDPSDPQPVPTGESPGTVSFDQHPISRAFARDVALAAGDSARVFYVYWLGRHLALVKREAGKERGEAAGFGVVDRHHMPGVVSWPKVNYRLREMLPERWSHPQFLPEGIHRGELPGIFVSVEARILPRRSEERTVLFREWITLLERMDEQYGARFLAARDGDAAMAAEIEARAAAERTVRARTKLLGLSAESLVASMRVGIIALAHNFTRATGIPLAEVLTAAGTPPASEPIELMEAWVAIREMQDSLAAAGEPRVTVEEAT